MSSPIESKVYASTIGTGAGAAVSAFALWLLGVLVWGVPDTAARAGDAIAAVPLPVAGLIGVAITAGGGFLAGWKARHTPRPEPIAILGKADPAPETPVAPPA